ncbi:hypothetical protein [Catelliglobosispora koreensis]|uniref:hypothetical protein n=1 Tax=Catelliglobosispora koreensis TaxID=129052 RepID=UPI0003789710|nr:hypothetical protein [Catelliglobosispora koreensis]
MTSEAPADLVQQAAENPGGWVYEINHEWVPDPNGFVPNEAIRGGWQVGDDGKLTGEFRENPNYGPPHDDFSKLLEPDHWLGWLGDDPAQAIRESVEEIIAEQVPGAVIEWMKITDTPKFLTAGRRDESDSSQLIVTKTGIAAPFAVGVRSIVERDILWGVHTIVIVGMDDPDTARSRVWFELRAPLDEAEKQLPVRFTELAG